MLWLSHRNFVLCKKKSKKQTQNPHSPARKKKKKKAGNIWKLTRLYQGIIFGEAHEKLTAHSWLLWECLDPQALDSALSPCPMSRISIQTSRNVKHFKPIAALFPVLPNVKLGACSIFGNFCVGGSKEGIKKISLAVNLRAHLGILFLESQEDFWHS